MRAAAVGVALLFLPMAAVAQTAAPPAHTPAQAPATAEAPPPVAIPFHGFEVVRAWPHDREAFTQGLIWHDGGLIESTGRFPSTVRRVRLEDGEVLRLQTLDTEYFGEGLTELNGKVFSLTWRNGRGFIWNAGTLERTGEFAYEGEGWGLTTDGTRLILSDGTDRLRFLDPDTFAESEPVHVTFNGQSLTQLNELEWIDGEVWANVWQTDFIVRIDPTTGAVKSVVDLRTLMPDRTGMDPADDVLNGIAWDPEGRRLFVTGKKWPSVFEIRLTGPQ
ncbi:glutaminyl-peptide cyclotransferase [Brevundimonas kwangchunensis]|uniref:Glutaminyl-peptide cyclotransferase n=1 Tax=Brevundimonas kwangchunensis TaxID=322163 RepID=A0ABP3RRY9_9CAUL